MIVAVLQHGVRKTDRRCIRPAAFGLLHRSRTPSFCRHFVDTAARGITAIAAHKAETISAVAKKGRLSRLERKRLRYTNLLETHQPHFNIDEAQVHASLHFCRNSHHTIRIISSLLFQVLICKRAVRIAAIQATLVACLCGFRSNALLSSSNVLFWICSRGLLTSTVF
jgi:hypothetical protein